MPSRETSTALLSRLVEKTTSHDGLGGKPKYPWEDIAGAMSGIPRGPVALVRSMYAMDGSSVKVAVLELRLAMEQDPIINTWKITKGQLTALCLQVVQDLVRPLLCRRCNGRGIIYPRGAAARECDSCAGVRVRAIHPRELAKALSVPAVQCGRRGEWRKRYDIVMALADEWIYQAMARVQKMLGECR